MSAVKRQPRPRSPNDASVMSLKSLCAAIRRFFARGARRLRSLSVLTASTSGTLSCAKLAKVTKRKLREMRYCARDIDLRRALLLHTVLRNTRSPTPTPPKAPRNGRKATSRGRARKRRRKRRQQAAQKRAAEFKFTMPDRAKERKRRIFKNCSCLRVLVRKFRRLCRL
ncbi:hypothetical protein MTO96_032825 [Rhipicephalus appendiculatus]